MSAAALTPGLIERSLAASADPIFGAPLSASERALWVHILTGAGKRRGTNFRKWLSGLSFFKQGSPFGASSGGAGGSVSTPRAVGTLAQPDSGNLFPWLYPPGNFINFDKYGTVALGAANAQTSIGGTSNGSAGTTTPITWNAASSMPWFVPNGYNGYIKTMALDFVANGGAAWTQGVLPPQLQFQLFVNNQGAYDYQQFFFSPGVVTAPTPVAGIPIKEQNLVQMFVTNLTVANTTQFVEARLQGYYYGKDLQPKQLAY